MADSPQHAEANPWIIAVSVMLATFMEVLDTAIPVSMGGCRTGPVLDPSGRAKLAGGR